MKKLLFLCLFVGFITSCKNETEDVVPTVPQRPTVLEEMIDLAETHSLNRLDINWSETRRLVNVKFSESGFEEAVRLLLRIMNTNHSWYISSSYFIYETEVICNSSDYRFADFPPSIGYVRVDGYTGSLENGVIFAQDIQDAIQQGTEEGKNHWVVDLSRNSGGNMYPMVAGLGPFLGEHVLGHFFDPEEKETIWGYKNDASYIGTENVTRVENPADMLDPSTKVAVIIDNFTVSSGEATAISFIGRPNTRFFGRATCGLSTGNIGFQLSDGAMFTLTATTMADRNKNLFGGPIQPDETFDDSAELQARIEEWLLEE